MKKFLVLSIFLLFVPDIGTAQEVVTNGKKVNTAEKKKLKAQGTVGAVTLEAGNSAEKEKPKSAKSVKKGKSKTGKSAQKKKSQTMNPSEPEKLTAEVKPGAQKTLESAKPAEVTSPVEPVRSTLTESVKPAENGIMGFEKILKIWKNKSQNLTESDPKHARKKRIEVGVLTSGGVSESSSPITDIEVAAKDGKNLRFVSPLQWKNVEFTLLFAEQSFDFSMAGVKLGEIGTTIFSSTARFEPHFSRYARPYVGAGVHYTKLEQSLLAGDTLKLGSARGIGPVVEYGVVFPFGDSGFYVDLNTSRYIWSAKGLRFETNTGNALVSTVSISNPHWTGISLGTSF